MSTLAQTVSPLQQHNGNKPDGSGGGPSPKHQHQHHKVDSTSLPLAQASSLAQVAQPRSASGKDIAKRTAFSSTFSSHDMPPKTESSFHSHHADSTPKRKTSTTPKHTHDDDDEDNKKETTPEDEKKSNKKRRKVNHACVYCRRSHMTCDQARPCSRCIKRDIGHLCHDEPREPKRTKSEPDAGEGEEEDLSPVQQQRPSGQRISLSGPVPPSLSQQESSLGGGSLGGGSLDLTNMPAPNGKVGQAQQQQQQQPQQAYNNNTGLYDNNDWTSQAPFGFQDINYFNPHPMFNTSEVNNEYNLLNTFLSDSLLDDAAMYDGGDPNTMFTDPSFSNTLGPMATSGNLFSNHTNQLVPPTQAADGNALNRPGSTVQKGVDDKAQEKYYMTAADPAGTEPPEERMNKLLKAKYDAGLLKPFNYVKGYRRLNQYMEKHMHPISRQKILRQLDAFRPMFRERMQSLTDVELIRVEMWFEMKLMEYDRVFASMAIPACCWRRTGEIFRGNREMAELIGVPVERLREGKLAIHDIIGEDSLVMYWTKFGQIAFDPSKKAMLASCTLKKPDNDVPGNDMRCCFSFTIQRDEHLIPSIIIGNFLPVMPNAVDSGGR